MTCVDCGKDLPTPTANPFRCPACVAPRRDVAAAVERYCRFNLKADSLCGCAAHMVYRAATTDTKDS